MLFLALENLLQTHINRLLVLRPLLNEKERLNELMTVFNFLGDPYDFNFDFEDISSQCCTELIYRSLHKRGPIQFSLINRFGRETLCADDIIQYYFSKETAQSKAFDFVLIAVEAPNSKINQAQILTGDNGKKTKGSGPQKNSISEKTKKETGPSKKKKEKPFPPRSWRPSGPGYRCYGSSG